MPSVTLGVGPREWSGNGYAQFQEQPSVKTENVGRAFSPDLSSYRQGDEEDFYGLKFPMKNTPILA